MIQVPDGKNLVHLQLRRFAGCPICNTHLRSVVQRKDEITRAGDRRDGQREEHAIDEFAPGTQPVRLVHLAGGEGHLHANHPPRAYRPRARGAGRSG